VAGPTLTEVAREAGVSLATASRVLNGSARTPAPEIADRVRRTAASLGYVANAQAQALARSSTRLLGLVVHDIADPYFSSIARGVQATAATAHRQVLLAAAEAVTGTTAPADAGHRTTSVQAAVQAFASYRTDAVIIAGSRSADPDPALTDTLAGYQQRGGRVVTVGQDWVEDASAVVVDNTEGSRTLVTALAADGHDTFAYLAGPASIVTSEERLAGYRQGVAEAGVTDLGVHRGGFGSAGGADAVRELLATGVLRTGRRVTVVAANDVMALGAAAALAAEGLRVPEDVALAGFDDIPPLAFSTPPLTTVRLPLEEIGRHAAELALEPRRRLVHVAGTVVRRASA